MNSASAVRDEVLSAVQAQNWDALAALTTPGVLVTLPDGRETQGLPALTAELRGLFSGDHALIRSLTLLPQSRDRVTPLRDGTAVLAGTLTAKAELPYHRALALETQWTGTFVRDEAGDWRLAAVHASTDAFKSPMTAALENYGVYAALIAALAALTVGFKLGRGRSAATRRTAGSAPPHPPRPPRASP